MVTDAECQPRGQSQRPSEGRGGCWTHRIMFDGNDPKSGTAMPYAPLPRPTGPTVGRPTQKSAKITPCLTQLPFFWNRKHQFLPTHPRQGPDPRPSQPARPGVSLNSSRPPATAAAGPTEGGLWGMERSLLPARTYRYPRMAMATPYRVSFPFYGCFALLCVQLLVRRNDFPNCYPLIHTPRPPFWLRVLQGESRNGSRTHGRAPVPDPRGSGCQENVDFDTV